MYNKPRIFLIVSLLFAYTFAIGQKHQQIDSLVSELHRNKIDTIDVQLLLTISMKYQTFLPDSAMYFAKASIDKAKAIHYDKGVADGLLQTGRIKREQNNTADALELMFEALKIYRDINDRVQIAHSLNDISIIYANNEDFNKSLEYFKQALAIFEQMQDDKGTSYALNNIGIIYEELGDLKMAKAYFIKSLNIKKKNNDVYGIGRAYNNLGSIAEDDKQWTEALLNYIKADSIFVVTNDPHAQSSNFLAIARIKNNQGFKKEAKHFASLALQKGESVKALSNMLSATQFLATLEENESNYKASLQYQKLTNQLSDSLNNENHRANMDELKAKFDIEEKEKEITLLKKDKDLQHALVKGQTILSYSLTAGIFLLLVMLALLYFAYHTAKSKKNSLALKNKEIEKQKNDLDKLNREKDRFFSILSHDLRTPLNSLKGFSYLLTEHVDALSKEELLTMRSKIDNSLDNLTELINNILEWSMSSSEKRRWIFDKINIAALIQRNISLYHATAESKNINLLFQSGENVFAYADYNAIDTVVRNLISNAVKFSHPNSDIVISTKRSDDKIFISIKDSGIGIPFDIQTRLFALNENIVQQGTHHEKGSGLGLTLCKELITENNGDITMTSVPEKGSEFIISIPEFRNEINQQ